MSTVNCLASEDQFLCPICLDVFTDPVSIPCGHNFCKSCITQHWDVNVQSQCPMCNKDFNPRPDLHINTFISEMAAQFKKSTQKKSSSSSEQQWSNTGEVLCDVCTESKQKALKSCLVCLTSYCDTHLEPHHRIPGLKRHQLIDPEKNLEDRICQKHDRPLELFCRTDRVCVCQFCTETDHKLHHAVSLTEEYEAKKTELGVKDAEVEQMMEERRVKIQQLKDSVKVSREEADRETADSVQVFTALIQSVERGLAQLVHSIEEKQQSREKQAEGFIKELEEEISELMKRSSEVEQLSHTEDHLQFLQSFSSLKPAPPTKDWTEVRVHSSYEGTVEKAVAQLEETLSEHMKKLMEAELRRVQQFAVDVTLDPDTAYPALILSDDGKRVHYHDNGQKLPDNPKRFSVNLCVVGKQNFSSGKFYYEVQVEEKTRWELGFITESVNRNEQLTPTPTSGLWILMLRNGNEYKACAGPTVSLTLKSKPEKVGVFVDYEEGLVSFYDADTAALIYSFTDCNFTEKIYPLFGPCKNDGQTNSAPLIISLVSHTD